MTSPHCGPLGAQLFSLLPVLLLLSCSLYLCAKATPTNATASTVSVQATLEQIQQEMATERIDGYFDYTNIVGFFMTHFVKNTFKAHTGDLPVLVYELDLKLGQLGNRLGNYFEALAFARTYGLHFVAFSHSSRLQESWSGGAEAGSASSDKFLKLTHPFVRALPTIHVHPNPVADRNTVVHMLQGPEGKIRMAQWPWAQPTSCLWNHIDFIGSSFLSAIRAYTLERHNATNLDKITIPASSFAEKKLRERLSATTDSRRLLMPDAVILFRCADILTWASFDYGFLNFNVYSMTITCETKSIYIIGEPLHYGPHAQICVNITNGLVDFLTDLYPNTTIAVRRGFVFDGMAMLSLAKTVVCAPSTFCFWPAVANRNSSVFYARSSLVYVGRTPLIHDNFHWITYPKVVTFGKQFPPLDIQHPEVSNLVLANLTTKVTKW